MQQMVQISFRTFIEGLEKDRLAHLLNHDDEVSFFFVKDGKVLGGSEDARMTFARMKNPDPEADKQWAKDATFVGMDVEVAAAGNRESAMRLLSFKDLKDLKVISHEDATSMLKKSKSKQEKNCHSAS
jgi:hypothetical protein